MKTYLVTGGAGFIGSSFIIHMLGANKDIRIINLDALTYAGNLDNLRDVSGDKRYSFVHGDIRDKELVSSVFANQEIDAAVNFAAETHVDRSIGGPDVFISTNITGTVNLLNAARAAWSVGDDDYRPGVKFVQISTDEVYGALGPEGFFTEETPLDPHSPYSASKASADMIAKAYYDTYKLPVNITRCSNNYGPRQHPEKLIPLMITNALSHKPLPVYGNGLQVRDWIHADDHCQAVELVIERGEPGRVYNIGGRNERRNIDIVKMIIDYINKNADNTVSDSLVTHVTDRKGHDWRYAIDPGKIETELGWRPKVTFENGMAETIRWYLSERKP